MITKLHDGFFLVNVVDNDFINGSLEKVFMDFIEENNELMKSI